MSHFDNTRGAVALIGVTIASLVILVITLAMTSLMVGELQQSIDAENQVVATYNAESQSELWLDTILGYLRPGQSSVGLYSSSYACDPVTGNDAGDNINGGRIHVCTSGSPYVTQFSDEPVQFGLNPGGSGVYNLDLKTALQSSDSYLELTVTNYQRNVDGSVNPATARPRTIFLCPQGNSVCTTGAVTGSVNYAPATTVAYFNNGGCGSANWNGVPGAAGSVAPCTMRLTNLLSNGPVGVFRAILHVPAGNGNGVTVEFDPLDSAATSPVDIYFPTAEIDATDNAGDSWARARQSVKLQTAGQSQITDVVNSNLSICKNFKVFSDSSGNPIGVQPGNPC
jgi:hypothetical protein